MATNSAHHDATPFDVEHIVREIQAEVAVKAAKGDYQDARVERLQRFELKDAGDPDYIHALIRSLRRGSNVDINDFEIRKKEERFASLKLQLKKVLWPSLKFYTFRLWSQQNEINSNLVTVLEATVNRYEQQISKLETRVRELEKRSDR